MAKVNYFLQQYQKMSRRDCRTFKEDCMAHFSWSEQTFYNKINFGHWYTTKIPIHKIINFISIIDINITNKFM